MKDISRIGDFSLQWGESVRWDDRLNRLYFVDCGTQRLHWLDDGEPPLGSLQLETIPTGVVLTEDGRLVVALGDGLYLVEPDAGTTELLDPYPDGLGGRANDANADLEGNLVTGTLNVAPGPGSYWRYSSTEGWKMLADGISNANGPVVLHMEGEPTLVFADTFASKVYAFPYDGSSGEVGERRILADTAELGGMPDGACADDDGAVWGCVLGKGVIARYTAEGHTETIETGVEYPSDVTFGGPNLDRMFFTSISFSIGEVEVCSPVAGALLVADGTAFRGRPEPRFKL